MLSPSFGYGVASGGVATTNQYHLIQTENLGTTWTVDGLLPLQLPGAYGPGNLLRIYFVNRDVGYVASYERAIFVTRDSGATWSKAFAPGIWPTFQSLGNVLTVVSDVCHRKVPNFGPAQCPSYLSTFRLGAMKPYSSYVVPQVGHAPWRAAVLLASPSPQQVVVSAGEIDGPGPGHDALLLTNNSGKTWRSIANPCPQLLVEQLISVAVDNWILLCFLDGGSSQGPSKLAWTTARVGPRFHQRIR